MSDTFQDWKGKKFNMMNPTELYWANLNIMKESDNLNNLYQGCSERAINALFFVNAGGIITVLANIHHNNYSSINILLNLSLVLFIVGLMLAIDVVARD